MCQHALRVGFGAVHAGMPLSSYVWDLSDPNKPEAELLGPSQLVCAKFNVKDANLVGAGQYNGQFAFFDTRKGTAPAGATPMDVCHRSAQTATCMTAAVWQCYTLGRRRPSAGVAPMHPSWC